MNKLKPCPFCGGEANVLLDESSDYREHWEWYVFCLKDCPMYFKSKEEAIKAWNTRAEDNVKGEMLEALRLADKRLHFINCPQCGDMSGVVIDGDGEPTQCQWCDENNHLKQTIKHAEEGLWT